MKGIALAVQDYLVLVGQVGRSVSTRRMVTRDLVEMDAIGTASLPIVLLTGLFTGMVLVLQTGGRRTF